MNITTPARRIAPRCLSYRPRVIAAHVQSRAASDDSNKSSTSNQWLEKVRNTISAGSSQGPQLSPQEQMLEAQKKMMAPGDITSGSIFEDDSRARALEQTEDQQREGQAETSIEDEFNEAGRDLVLDPRPKTRINWERRKVMKMVRKSGRITREELLARTEREHLAKSQNMKTSVKKLGALARQIAGKPLDEAMAQMDFSKKKAAILVADHLEAAKHEAVVARGMGLGAVKREGEEDAKELEPVKIRLKNNKRYTVTDPTKLYIDQAWVGRGPYGKLPDFRARGRVYMMRTPWTSLTVILKEEATRVREHAERVAKDKKKRATNVWKHLPDRPLQGPRGQYYSW